MKSLLAMLMMTTAAAAQPGCNTDLIKFVDYAITPVDGNTNRMTTTFKSEAKKPIRMIDASAGYRDALGGRIASFTLDRDTSIAPGQTFEQTGLWGPHTFERLLDLKKEEVQGYVCVRAILYDDGTKETFGKAEQ